MQYYSNGSYGVPDMQQLALAAASHHMFSDGHYQQQQQQLHHQHQQYQQSLQSQDFVDFYHRQAAASLQEPEVQGTHNMLAGLHHYQQFQEKVPSLLDSSSLHLPLSHHISLGGPETASLAPVASKLQASTTRSHDLVPHYKPSVEEDFVHHGAPGDDSEDASLNGSRWPHVETLALLRIRSEMDAMFRDASAITEPQWDEVSRKLHETGCRRSGRECKEKFEEVQKYCKKTKDGKPERQNGKMYRFHTDLETIYAASQEHDMEGGEIVAMAGGGDNTALFPTIEASGMRKMEGDTPLQVKETSPGCDSPSSISCGDAAVEQQMCGRKRKRNSSWRTMRAFFEDLATQLMERQDALHKKFLEAIEKREEVRTRREEAYKRQEMARMSREQDLRVREQVLAETRDAVLVAFLQKVTGETLHLPEMATQSVAAEAAAAAVAAGEAASTPSGEDPSTDCIKDQGGVDANSRRWPKVEVLALIRVRTSLEPRFQEAGPKAQLWEEVSSSMSSLGFSRSAKRCKEKWENINKYYRKTKDNVGRKLRPESATKTCPYFHQLELLYERGILASPNGSKFVCKLDGSQTSGELMESSSRDESQHTNEGFGSGNLDHPPDASMSISNVQSIPSNLQTTTPSDGRGMVVDVARLSTTTCSSTGKVVVFRDGSHAHDMDAISNGAKAELGCLLSPADQINVNCYPPHHFSSSNRSQKGQLPAQEEPMSSCHVSPGMLGISSGSLSHFMREMMEIQQPPLYHESHQLDGHHNEHTSPGMEMQNASEEQDIETRMQQQQEQDEEKARTVDNGRSHHGSATLMAVVHKLAAGGGGGGGDCGPTSEFDLSLSSPASSCGQV